MKRYYARLRHMDMDILWPSILAEAKDLDVAKALLYKHAMMDPAWRILGEEAIVEFIDKLEVYD
jgi:hypothetical protein